jgi:hypothetical protein
MDFKRNYELKNAARLDDENYARFEERYSATQRRLLLARRCLGCLTWLIFTCLAGLLVYNGLFLHDGLKGVPLENAFWGYSLVVVTVISWLLMTALALFGPEDMWESGH